MKEFFTHLLNKLEILTGIRQLERLQDKPQQLNELLDACVEAVAAFTMKEEIKKTVLMDAVTTDPDFIGLNVKWVRKTLNNWVKIHGMASGVEQTKPDVDPVQGYQAMIEYFTNNTEADEHGIFLERCKENLELVRQGKPAITDHVTTAIIEHFKEQYIKQIAGSFIDVAPVERKTRGQQLRESLYK